jgi:preprotein translocase subunit SecB
MNKQEFKTFQNAIEAIDIKKIYMIEGSFRYNDDLSTQTVTVTFEGKTVNLHMNGNTFIVDYRSRIFLTEDNNDTQVFSSSFVFRMLFTLKQTEEVETLMKSEEALRFFKEVQIKKIIAPYIREYFHSILSRTTLTPFDLPLFK